MRSLRAGLNSAYHRVNKTTYKSSMGENMNNKLQLCVLKKSFLEYDPGGLILNV